MKQIKNIRSLNIAIMILIVLALAVLLSIFIPDLTDKYVLPISKIIGLLSLSSGAWIAIGEYRLKVSAEIRLSEAANAENDVKLLNLFTQTFDIAHSRKESIVSEKVVEKLFDKSIITNADYADMDKMNAKIALATRTIPVGLASQEAAITAIGELGSRYPILREAALQGLKSLSEQMKVIPQNQKRVLTPIDEFIQSSINKINSGR